MQLLTSKFNQPIFMAHTYKVEPKNRDIYIQTNNEDKLGEKPYYVSDIDDEKYEKEMQHEVSNGKELYSINQSGGINPFYYYHIEYKDTGKIDKKNGQEYCYNPISMMEKASVATRLQHRQPLVHTLKEGKTVGKIKWEKSNVWKKNDDIIEPTILVTRTFHSNLDNPNIVGLIFTSDNIAEFSHESTRLRQETNVCGAVLEPDIIRKLISLDGKNVELEIKDNKINFEETDKPARPIEFKTINVPKLKPSDKILTSKEYSSDIIGAKAVNLRRLEELKERGKIDVIIPKSIALPSGYLEPFLYGYDKKDIDSYTNFWNEYMKSGKLEKVIQILKDNGIDGKDGLMVRSSFNGEDLPDYSAAGVYHSTVSTMEPESLFERIDGVANSKYDHNAQYTRKLYNIPEENIQPGIILQERINPDYKYTLYTDDGKGNLKIEMYSDRAWRDANGVQPHVFTYNKKTKELSYDSIQMRYPMATFNENEEIIELEPIENDLSNKKELFEQIKKVAQNALVVEKEFGAPQDIEGGIKGDNIYFWQSRNIVN